ncbi:MAG: tagatose 1,6-diphosphate aldolase [Dehalococcoidia bacterium]|nr:tagatose 1,6-diphosphate aldolase [Dehalococcoidia bacterium]
MRTISIGKLRGLQQLANGHGILTMCALDHRGSLKRMLADGTGKEIGNQEMVDFKLDLSQILAPRASAILLDPVYGAGQAIAAGVLPKITGLLVSIEKSGYSGSSGSRITELLPNWNVRKIKKMGATAVKLLLYYRPDLDDVSEKQLELVGKLALDCENEDIPLVVEPVSYSLGSREDRPQDFACVKPQLVIRTAEQITAFPIDVLKAEFPADLKYETDENRLFDLCRQLNVASQVPWVILSAGVNFDMFYREVEIACRSGASGFLAGRALWQEATDIRSRHDRKIFLETTVLERLDSLTELANKYATPWYKKLSPSKVDETWYQHY